MMQIGWAWPWDIDGNLEWAWQRWEYEDCHGFRLLGLEIHWHEEKPRS